MSSVANFLKISLPVTLVAVLITFSVFTLLSVNKLYSEENLNLEGSVISLMKQSIQDPLNYGDHVEVTRRLLAVVGQGGITDVCTKTESFSFSKCDASKSVDNYTKVFLKSPALSEDFIFYVQFTHKSFIDKVFWILIPLIFFSILIFSLGYFIMRKYEQVLIDDFKTLADSLLTKKMTNTFYSVEFKNIKEKFVAALADLKRINFTEIHFALSQKLAHDIRSPLSTLSLISSKIENSEIRNLQVSVINQITNIANDLLTQSKNAPLPNQNIERTTYTDLFKQLNAEFDLKYKSKIIFSIPEETADISVHAPVFLYASLNNLIQNALEATAHLVEPLIQVSVRLIQSKEIEIKVVDNGKGIPADVLSTLGKRPISFGKDVPTSGNGIGVFNTYKEVVNFNGKMHFESLLNQKTSIGIVLPISTFL